MEDTLHPSNTQSFSTETAHSTTAFQWTSTCMFYHLRALRHIRPVITNEDANMIACSVVSSRLDYDNAVLYDVSPESINCLQRIQNALARCVVDTGFLFSIKLNSKQRSSHSLHTCPLPVHIPTHQWLSICRHARSVLKTVAFSLFRSAGRKRTN